jgi:hypothetical protein
MKRNLPVLLLVILVGFFTVSSSNKDKKDLQLTRVDAPQATPFSQHRPTGEMNTPEAAIIGQAASAEYPFIIWNTFLGSNAIDEGLAIAVDTHGNIYVAGTSGASWGDPRRPYYGGTDAFVAKLDADGNILWNTFLGGTGDDSGRSIAVDAGGNAYITGSSSAAWGSPLLPYSGQSDGYVAKLSASGTLLWSTLFGSNREDESNGIAVDNSGDVCATGSSSASWGVPLRHIGGGRDAFLVKFAPTGSLRWNTFLGNSRYSYGNAIGTDGMNNIYLTGRIPSPYYAQSLIAKSDANGAWQWIKGVSSDAEGKGLAVGDEGDTYITGTYYCDMDYFGTIHSVDRNGKLSWSNDDLGCGGDVHDAAIGSGSAVYLTGSSSGDWHETPLNSPPGYDHAFLTVIDHFSSDSGWGKWVLFLGGSGFHEGNGIAYRDGNVYIIGSSDAPWGDPRSPFRGSGDAFVAKLQAPFPLDRPEAQISAPPAVCRPPQEVRLDGSGSRSANRKITGYSWGLRPPAGSAARLSASDQALVRFTADIPGDYVVSLKVKDSPNWWSEVVFQTVRATAGDPPGVAIHGTRKSVHAWIIHKDYAELTLFVSPPASGCELPIAGYRLLRRTGQGDWATIRDLADADFTSSEETLTLSLIDKFLEPGTAYLYRLAAIDAEGKEAAATEITL